MHPLLNPGSLLAVLAVCATDCGCTLMYVELPSVLSLLENASERDFARAGRAMSDAVLETHIS